MRIDVIVMTKFPEPGKVKTRLIPELGKTGACRVHQAMADHVISQMQSFCSEEILLKVHVAGGSDNQVGDWLSEISHYRQIDGNLGDKMSHAVHCSFQGGAEQVIVIGTDCLSIDNKLLREVSHELLSNDVVYVPALDGGYVLVGLSGEYLSIFQDIDWGTEKVMMQSIDKVEREALRVKLLETQPDIDHPEDLRHFEAVLGKLPVVEN